MAAYNDVVRTKHPTLTAATVDTVTFTRDLNSVEVKNRGSAEIYFTTDGTVPTVGGDGTEVVGPGEALRVEPDSGTATVVKLISSGASPYSVRGI